MKRTLSITVDDEAGTIETENVREFKIHELLGIAEYLKIGATVELTQGFVRAQESNEK